MICCLLALLAAIPGVSMIRSRMPGLHLGQGHCTADGRYGVGRDVARAVVAAAVIVVLVAAALAIHVRGLEAGSHLLGPVCSALDRAVLPR